MHSRGLCGPTMLRNLLCRLITAAQYVGSGASALPGFRQQHRWRDFSRDQVKSRLREFGIFVPHLDETHPDQGLQMPWIDRRQLPALGANVPKGPTQGNRFFKTEVSERALAINHHMLPADWSILSNRTSASQRFSAAEPESKCEASDWFRIGSMTICCTAFCEVDEDYRTPRLANVPCEPATATRQTVLPTSS